MTTVKSIIAGLGFAFIASSVSATTIINNAETGLQTLVDSTISGGSINVQTDYIANDDYWNLTNGGTSVATFMLELTGNYKTQTFGIYDIASNGSVNYVEIFVGADTNSARKEITIYEDGEVYVSGSGRGAGSVLAGTLNAKGIFGFYTSNGKGSYSHSDDALNGGVDKMLAYHGRDGLTIDVAGDGIAPLSFTNDDYILAFEDWTDNDFQDLVVNVSSITPVPTPSVMALMGLGLIGLGFTRRRAKKA